MFLPLAFGGRMVMVENLLALQTAPQREKVSLVNTGPSLLDALLRTGALPPGVTTVILAGEKLSRSFGSRCSLPRLALGYSIATVPPRRRSIRVVP